MHFSRNPHNKNCDLKRSKHNCNFWSGTYPHMAFLQVSWHVSGGTQVEFAQESGETHPTSTPWESVTSPQSFGLSTWRGIWRPDILTSSIQPENKKNIFSEKYKVFMNIHKMGVLFLIQSVSNWSYTTRIRVSQMMYKVCLKLTVENIYYDTPGSSFSRKIIQY